VLEVGDFAGGSGTINSWSLIVQPAGSPSTTAGTSPLHHAAPLLVTALSPVTAPSNVPPLAGRPLAGRIVSTPADNIAPGSPVRMEQIAARSGAGHMRDSRRDDPIGMRDVMLINGVEDNV
jgi:hypothetical protein